MGCRLRLRGLVAAGIYLSCAMSLQAQVAVTTYHNDNSRTGQNTQETILTPANVNSTQFGKLFTTTVDGVVYAQPLYLPNVSVGGGAHNVLYVATQHDSVYAIDADSGAIYWQRSLIPSGGSTVSSATDLNNCGDIRVEVGITGTPVIDPTTDTLYVVAKVKLNGVIYQYLHALNVGTGADKFGGPVNIEATVAGTASDGNGSTLTFNARQENQRAALLLENGHVIIGWASHCDKSPWHGWVISYDAATLAQEAVYNSSPTGYANGIWMSGSGLAADTSGNIYASTGNGSWNSTDRGDSVLKLGAPSNSTFPVLDYFTPYDQAVLASHDTDMSAGGLILLPTTNGKELLTTTGKSGTLYLIDRTNMGKYCVDETPACSNSDPNVLQEIPGILTGYWGVPAYWNGHLYFGGGNDNTGDAEPLKSYSFNAGNSGRLSTSATSVTAKNYNFPGPDPSVSANGTSDGIVWGMDNSRWQVTCSGDSNCQTLFAYDATNLSNMLYNSNQAPNNRDVPGSAVKFTTPTIANGKVYVGSQGAVSGFGLLSGAPRTAAAPSISPAGGTYASAQSVSITDATPGATLYYTTNGAAPTTASTHYTGAFSIAATTTVKAVAAATGYTTSPVSTAAYTIGSGTTPPPTGGSTPVNLAVSYNVSGIDNSGSADTNGGLDTHGYSYAGALLGSTVTWAGLSFDLGAAGGADAASGTTLALTQGNYSTLNLLASGVNGAQPGQTFVVTYTDGTTTTITQSLSDWYTPQNYAGESKAVTMAYRLTATGAQDNRTFYLYGYSFAINSAKTVKSVTLPNNRNVVVLAATLSGTTTTTTPPAGTTAVSLSAFANVRGDFNNGSPVTNGGLDTHGFAYSANLLGTSATWSDTTFSLGAAGAADAASGVTIALPAGSFSSVKLLATAVNGSQAAQSFVVTYTDGTTTTVTQSLSDWYSPQGYSGESSAVTMAYRLTATGAEDNRTFHLYGYSLAINSAKTVKSLTLPNNRNVVVLAATLSGAATTTPTGGATAVNLASATSVYGVFNNGSTVTNGGLDTHSFAYSETLLGKSLAYGGVNYTLLGSGAADTVSNATVTLPAGRFSTLHILATGLNGAQTAQTFKVTYTDGTTTAVTQSLSDWYTPQNYTGESKAVTMAYRLTPTGAADDRTFYLYAYSLAINNAKTVKSLTLPDNRNVVVLAATLVP